MPVSAIIFGSSNSEFICSNCEKPTLEMTCAARKNKPIIAEPIKAVKNSKIIAPQTGPLTPFTFCQASLYAAHIITSFFNHIACIIFALPHTLHLVSLTQIIICFAAGAILLLISLYLFVGYLFASYAIIDRDISPWKAMELSRKAISKRWFFILGTIIWVAIVLIVSAILLVVGLIWTVPYVQNIFAILYRDMIGIEGKDPVTLKESHL